MRSIFKNKIIFIIFGILLLQSSIFAQSLKIDFPDINGWGKSGITQYPVSELGYSINYSSEKGGRVTVYVYDGGLKSVPDDIEHEIIKNEIDRAKKEIQFIAQRGIYKNLKELKSDTVTLGGENGRVKALHTSYSLSAGGRDLTSEIYVFGFQNYFVKFRATRLFEEGTNAEMTTLLNSMDKLFSKKNNLAKNFNFQAFSITD